MTWQKQMAYSACEVGSRHVCKARVIAELRNVCCRVSMTVTVGVSHGSLSFCLHACWGVAAQSKVAVHVILIFV